MQYERGGERGGGAGGPRGPQRNVAADRDAGNVRGKERVRGASTKGVHAAPCDQGEEAREEEGKASPQALAPSECTGLLKECGRRFFSPKQQPSVYQMLWAGQGGGGRGGGRQGRRYGERERERGVGRVGWRGDALCSFLPRTAGEYRSVCVISTKV